MTDKKSESRPTPQVKKGTTFLPTLITVTILLLGVIGYLLNENYQGKQLTEEKMHELEESIRLKAELDVEYNNALSDLENLKGINEEMDAVIEVQEEKLEEQKGKIAGLLKDKRQLKKARAEIKNLKVQVEQYLAEVENLKTQNQQLAEQNYGLVHDKETLTKDLQQQLSENAQLNEARAVLVSQRDNLAATVHFASVIKVDDIEVVGVKTRPRGKSVARKSAKSIDQLRVCFTTDANEIVEPSIEKFYVRIVNPVGETMAIEDLGSGSIQNPSTGEDIRYTQTAETEYDNTAQNLCFLWEPKTSFQSGSYEIEVYNKGYLVGKDSFVLK